MVSCCFVGPGSNLPISILICLVKSKPLKIGTVSSKVDKKKFLQKKMAGIETCRLQYEMIIQLQGYLSMVENMDPMSHVDQTRRRAQDPDYDYVMYHNIITVVKIKKNSA